MTALFQKISDEHMLRRVTSDGGIGVYGQPLNVYEGYACECGWTTTNSDETTAHIAEVTLQEAFARIRAVDPVEWALAGEHAGEAVITLLNNGQ